MNNILKFSKVRDVKTPTRGTTGSAGLDFYIPNDFKETAIAPNESVLIPSGIKVNFKKEYVLVAFNKSGIAAKKSLLVGSCVIDSDYEGEIHINLHNVGCETQEIKPGDKIIQFLLLPINYPILEEKNINYLYDIKSERGDKGFGSTGNN